MDENKLRELCTGEWIKYIQDGFIVGLGDRRF